MNNNFRSYLLNLSLLVGVTAPPCTAIVQAPINNVCSESVVYLVAQLERISNAHSQLLTQLQQQISDNQRDIDLLRGQIQESKHLLSQLVERQKHIYQEINNLSGKELTAKTGTDGSSDDYTEYNEATALVLKKKEYHQAISAFQSFVKRYPDSIYQPNANYWLGQLNYHQGKKNDALYYFAFVAKTYPKSHKAPEALLKVGMIMQEKGQKDKARAVYEQVRKLYPSDEAAKQAQKRLSGM